MTQLNHLSFGIILLIYLKNDHSNSIEKNRDIFYSKLYILFLQLCESGLLLSSKGTRASYSETSCDFFFQSDRPTQYRKMHSMLNEKKRGWPKTNDLFKIKLVFIMAIHTYFIICHW